MLTLRDSREERDFRTFLRGWIESEFPKELGWRTDYESLLEVDRVLARANLLAVGWPVEYGGRGLPPLLEAVLTEEFGAVGVLRSLAPSHGGVNNLGPALIAHATAEQKAFHLQGILAVEHIWCQG